jgi:hypothetical protein
MRQAEDASFFEGEIETTGRWLSRITRYLGWMISTAALEIGRFLLLVLLFVPASFHRPLGCIGILIGLYGFSLSGNTMLMRVEWGALTALSVVVLIMMPAIYARIRYAQFPEFRG